MSVFLLQRLLTLIATLLGASAVVFAVLEILPGNAAQVLMGPDADPEAVAAAERTAQQLLNRYREGQVGYTEVVTAQAAALSAQRALLQLQVNRQLAVVALVQALGGGWQAPWQVVQ